VTHFPRRIRDFHAPVQGPAANPRVLDLFAGRG
jgi:hypothetical protein